MKTLLLGLLVGLAVVWTVDAASVAVERDEVAAVLQQELAELEALLEEVNNLEEEERAASLCNPNPCKNGGTCLSNVTDFMCRCRANFEGRYCQEESNPCGDEPCLNGGTCLPNHPSYTCVCKAPFTGKNCDGDTSGPTYELCQDLMRDGITKSGEYELARSGKKYKMYCEFHEDFGYTYLPAEALDAGATGPFSDLLNVQELQTDTSRVNVRFRNQANGEQHDTVLGQLEKFNKYPIEVFINGNGDGKFQGPVQKNLKPYLNVGFVPKFKLEKKTIQGFSSNGGEKTFTNCDANPNAHFTFYRNENNSPGDHSYALNDREDGAGSLMDKWRKSKTATPQNLYLPERYFMDVEAHWGGCGAWEWTKKWAVPTKFALGITFKAPLPLIHGKYCADAYKDSPNPATGRYSLKLDGGLHEVFCQFEANGGYTFWPKPSIHVSGTTDKFYGKISPQEVQTDNSKVMVRFSDGNQFDTLLEQIDKFKSYPIEIFINGNGNGKYQGPVQANLKPYMNVGFVPKSVVNKKDLQGFRSNGGEKTFTNCDANPNAHFTFYRNQNDSPGDHSYALNDREDGAGSLMNKWRSSRVATAPENRLISKYFMDVEAHWGGCGAWEWTKKWAVPTKFALGIAFKKPGGGGGGAGGYDCGANNPCTPENAKKGLFYFPASSSPNKFVQCSEWGQCYIMPCGAGTKWNDAVKNCT